jgi:Holliday junction resolvase RusA-like endonuclease
VKIVVYGTPAPQGSKRYLGRTKAGRGIIVEANDNTAPWRSDVMTAARDAAYETPPYEGALVARMVFSFWRPKTVKFNKRPFPSTTPDLSKLLRSTEDALSAAGVWKDDALVVEYTRVAKVYVDEDPEALERPGAIIWVQTLVDLEALGEGPLGRR